MSQIIKVGNKPSFCTKCARHLSELLNQPISFLDVMDELTLYEWGAFPKNEVLSGFVVEYLKQVTIYNPESKEVEV